MNTYMIIDLSTGFGETEFNQLKPQGIVETDWNTVVKSLDGSKCILKRIGSVPQEVQSYVLWSGDLDGIHQYLNTNHSEWFMKENYIE